MRNLGATVNKHLMYLWFMTCFPLTYPMYHSTSWFPLLTPSFSTSLIISLFITVYADSASTVKSSIFLPNRETISIKSLICDGLWVSQLTHSPLSDTNLSSSYCMCQSRKEQIWTKGLIGSGWMILKGGLRGGDYPFHIKHDQPQNWVRSLHPTSCPILTVS